MVGRIEALACHLLQTAVAAVAVAAVAAAVAAAVVVVVVAGRGARVWTR